MNDLTGLKDIKPSIEVADYSMWVLAVLVILGILLLGILGYWLSRYFKKRKADTRAYYLHKIKTLNLDDSKTSAYAITQYSRFVVNTDKQRQFAAALDEELERYKYKKEVEPFDDKTLDSYHLFVKVLDDQH